MNEHTHIPFPRPARGEPDDSELRKVWSLLGLTSEPAPPVAGTDAAWRSLSERLDLGGGEEAPSRTPAIRAVPGSRDRTAPDRTGALRRRRAAPSARARPLLRAAALTGLLAAGAAGWYQVPVTRSAGPGERLAVALPDGSTATLNAGSTIRFRRAFSVLPGVPSEVREIHLSGEAFFEVVSDGRRFRVEAGDAGVTVLGTRFDVRVRNGAGSAPRVAVEEGRVEVRDRRRGGEAVVLSAGEAARLAAQAGTPLRETVRSDRVAAWRSGGLTAVDEPLSAIVDELELRYATHVSLSVEAGGSTRLSVYYPSLGTLESVLSDLATQQDLRYRRTADGWELF